MKSIRRQKQLRKVLEDDLSQLMLKSPWTSYLQENFFTLRMERYVLPIRLDGRGRLPASIIDTSDSGQTLFMEPHKVSEKNKELRDLELSEKLEIIRLFSELTNLVKNNKSELRQNYKAIINFDIFFSQALLAYKMSAVSISLKDEPTVKLRQARHPLLALKKLRLLQMTSALTLKRKKS